MKKHYNIDGATLIRAQIIAREQAKNGFSLSERDQTLVEWVVWFFFSSVFLFGLFASVFYVQ